MKKNFGAVIIFKLKNAIIKRCRFSFLFILHEFLRILHKFFHISIDLPFIYSYHYSFIICYLCIMTILCLC